MPKQIPIERANTDRVLHAERDEIDATLKVSFEQHALQREADLEGTQPSPADDVAPPCLRHFSLACLDGMVLWTATPPEPKLEAALLQARRAAERNVQALAQRLSVDRATTDRLLTVERASADRAVAARDEILGMASHDLRGLIGMIGLSAELLGTVAVKDVRTIKTCASDIEKLTERMTRLVEDLTDFTRIETGRLSFNPAVHDAWIWLRDAAALFAPVAAARGIVIERDAETSPILLSSFDVDRISQVLNNLVGNALKFTPRDGRICLAAQRMGGELLVSVRDSGCGIAADALEHVFERFWQVAGGTGVGSGLGLYISRCIVEAHGGRIWAESTLGQGTTFSFTLPMPTSGTTHGVHGPVR